MNEENPIINEKTLIPLSFLFMIIIGVVRVESTSFRANANEKEITVLKDDNRQILRELQKHGEALARIEEKLTTK
jgi:hypothetical protein